MKMNPTLTSENTANHKGKVVSRFEDAHGNELSVLNMIGDELNIIFTDGSSIKMAPDWRGAECYWSQRQSDKVVCVDKTEDSDPAAAITIEEWEFKLMAAAYNGMFCKLQDGEELTGAQQLLFNEVMKNTGAKRDV